MSEAFGNFHLFQVVKLGDPLNNYTSTNSFCCTGINGALATPSLVLHSILLALTSVSIPYIYSTCSVCTLVILVSLHNTFELFEKIFNIYFEDVMGKPLDLTKYACPPAAAPDRKILMDKASIVPFISEHLRGPP